MSLQEFQNQIDHWIRTTGRGYHSVLTNTAILMEEVGELSSVLARTDGDQKAKMGDSLNYEEEMADILWVLICLANQKGVDLTKALSDSIAKKNIRDKERFQ